MALFGWFGKKKTEKADAPKVKPEPQIRYEFDSECQVLIKCSSQDMPRIIDRTNPVWRSLGPQDEQYARAIYLGQGCWERLVTITEERAMRILTEWGYSFESK